MAKVTLLVQLRSIPTIVFLHQISFGKSFLCFENVAMMYFIYFSLK